MTQAPRFHRLARALGAEVSGVELRLDVDDEILDAVRRGLLESQVLFCREQALSEAEHLRLARRFGTPSVYPIALAAGATDPLTFIEDTAERPPVSDNRHTDLTWAREPPVAAL